MTNDDTFIPVLAPVAVAIDVPTDGLTRGQVGTVVEFLAADAERELLVEFSNEEGETYALVPLKPEQLIVLHRRI